jgi:hypothetical protein
MMSCCRPNILIKENMRYSTYAHEDDDEFLKDEDLVMNLSQHNFSQDSDEIMQNTDEVTPPPVTMCCGPVMVQTTTNPPTSV